MNDPAAVDYREVLTVFVSTVGSPTFETCLRCLEEQDCLFTLKVIEGVAPMNAALQKMLDDCTTPYFVQVDEDMLLYPHAIRTLYERFAPMPQNVAQYVCTLFDEYLQRVIYGLKISRHTIVRDYPYRPVTGCEWDQVHRFRADGFLDVRVPIEGAMKDSEDTLGLHGTYWEPETIYLRFRVLEIKRRGGNRTHDWVVEAAQNILKRFLSDPSELDFYALMGILGGFELGPGETGKEKDFRTYDQTPGLRAAQQFLEDVGSLRKG